MPIASVDPCSGRVVRAYAEYAEDEVDYRVNRAVAAADAQRLTPVAIRAALLERVADLLEERAEQGADLITLEVGKPLRSSLAEVRKSAAGLRYYARHAVDLIADEPADATAVGAKRAFGRYLPLGVVLGVMPWNFPIWQAIRFIAPALAAGNACLLKHASNVPACALFLEDLVRDAGFPEGSLEVLLIPSSRVAGLIADHRVGAVTLTGSEDAGVSVGRSAGAALKKVVLELGGSDAFIVMPSADLDRSADVAVTARTQNAGQSCIAAKRFIVHESIYASWLDHFVAGMAALVVGDPRSPETDVGPLATGSGRDEVAEQVATAVRQGAELRLGGYVPAQQGWWYPPTVLTGVDPSMGIYHEEVFGPVATVYAVASADEAVRIANDTRFGLGSSVWTNDDAEIERFVRDLAAGQTFVNGMVASYPELPFGGVKASGHGRELSQSGIREFTNLKTVWVG